MKQQLQEHREDQVLIQIYRDIMSQYVEGRLWKSINQCTEQREIQREREREWWSEQYLKRWVGVWCRVSARRHITSKITSACPTETLRGQKHPGHPPSAR